MDNLKIETLLHIANEEFDAALRLAKTNPRQAAYFASQAAEKAARAICVAHGVHVGISHNFGQIAATLPSDNVMRSRINSLDVYSSDSTKHRYPTASGGLSRSPSAEQVDRKLEEVRIFIEDANSHIRTVRSEKDLETEDSEPEDPTLAPSVKPPRRY